MESICVLRNIFEVAATRRESQDSNHFLRCEMFDRSPVNHELTPKGKGHGVIEGRVGEMGGGGGKRGRWEGREGVDKKELTKIL